MFALDSGLGFVPRMAVLCRYLEGAPAGISRLFQAAHGQAQGRFPNGRREARLRESLTVIVTAAWIAPALCGGE